MCMSYRVKSCLGVALLIGTGGIAPVAMAQPINEDYKIVADDGAAFDYFGRSIAIASGFVVVGADLDGDNGSSSGAAYIYNLSTGDQVAKLLPNDGAANDWFGLSVAVSNNIVVVGAYGDDDNGGGSGSVYLFNVFGANQLMKLLPNDGAPGDSFGISVAIDGDTIAVGAYGDDVNGANSGSVYIFSASTGAQIVKIVPADGATDDRFGWCVALDSGLVAIGARQADDNGFHSGSAYVYNATTGALAHKLLPNDGASGDFFGQSIAFDNRVVAVGAYRDDDDGPESGSVYLFSASTGLQTDKILPINRFDEIWTDRLFGKSVSIDLGVLAVGASGEHTNGVLSGAAYLFDISTGTQRDKLLPSDGAPNGFFGSSIAISGQIIGVGSELSVGIAPTTGSAYVFDTHCPADINGDGVLNFFDVSHFLAAFTTGHSEGDFNGDGVFNFFDVSAFLAAFAAGCP